VKHAAIHIFNILPPAATKPKRINLDGLTAKLAGITKAVRATPAKKAATEAIDVRQRHDATPARLAEMNKRNREYWHK
jgi:hypothetical protein